MTLTDDELLEVIDEVTIALGEILLRHRQLRESLMSGDTISASQNRIEKRRAEIEKEREKIRKTREVIRRRRELEKIRRDHEKTEVAEIKSTATTSPILNGKGAVIGWFQRAGQNRTNILSRQGRVVARLTNQVLPLRA